MAWYPPMAAGSSESEGVGPIFAHPCAPCPLPWTSPWMPWAAPCPGILGIEPMLNFEAYLEQMAPNVAPMEGGLALPGPGMAPGLAQTVPPAMPPALGVDLSKAMAAAQTATNACGSGCIPVAARQVQGLGALACRFGPAWPWIQEPPAFTLPTMNLSLAEHLQPIPEAESPPRTPPPRATATGNEAFPTPSPVSYRAAAAPHPHPHPLGVEKMQQSVSGLAVADHMATDVVKDQTIDVMRPAMWPEAVAVDRTWETWNEKKPPRQSRDKISNGNWSGWSWEEPPVASLPAETPPSLPQETATAEKWEAPRRKNRKSREMSRWERWMVQEEFSASEDGSQNWDQEASWLQDESEGGLLSKTVWYLIEEVLIQRPHLEAGKRVTVPFPSWVNSLPRFSGYHWERGPKCDEKRSLVNRALRTMSKKLPGCCWTVDMQAEEMQVHLADVARFSRFCDGM
ncbi:unnamed protein product [Cladocopium goreaui]|uniref:Uncharacterized protein n=1 Tax=Cladocopium goreaui TaxID=2562237 RepID=A0A9P1CT20_9DINO|nr:unnamed protein product [Cladocopium goreaui]